MFVFSVSYKVRSKEGTSLVLEGWSVFEASNLRTVHVLKLVQQFSNSLGFFVPLAATFPKRQHFFVQYSVYERLAECEPAILNISAIQTTQPNFIR